MTIPQFIYGTAWKKEATTRLVELALAAGFRAIDTANQAKHYSEALVGEALKRSAVKREELWLQSKFTSIDGQDHRLPYDPKAPIAVQVEQSFASSLEHLHTDYLDSYLLHGPRVYSQTTHGKNKLFASSRGSFDTSDFRKFSSDIHISEENYSSSSAQNSSRFETKSLRTDSENYPLLGDEDFEVWQALEKIYHRGAAKKIGISNVNLRQLEMLVKWAQIKPAFVQNRCYANRNWDFDVRNFCQKHKIFYQGFSLLTANPQIVGSAAVARIAQKYGVDCEQIIFCFCTHIGIIPLTGTSDEAHMKADLKIFDFELLAEEIATISALA